MSHFEVSDMTDSQKNVHERRKRRMLDAIFCDCRILLRLKKKIIPMLDRLETLDTTGRRQLLHNVYASQPAVHDILTYLLLSPHDVSVVIKAFPGTSEEKKELLDMRRKYRDSLRFLESELRPERWWFLTHGSRHAGRLFYRLKELLNIFFSQWKYLIEAKRCGKLQVSDLSSIVSRCLQCSTIGKMKLVYLHTIEVLRCVSNDWHVNHRKVMLELLQGISIPDQSFILDVGCGSGLILTDFSVRYAPKIAIGMDVRRIKFPSDGVNKHFRSGAKFTFTVSGDGANIPFKGSSFDLVIGSEVIEHIKHYQGFLKDIHDALKPKGYLILSTPDEPIYKDSEHVHNLVRSGTLTTALNKASFDVLSTTSARFSRGMMWYFSCQKRAPKIGKPHHPKIPKMLFSLPHAVGV